MTMTYAGPISGRSFTPALPGDALTGIQSGTMRYRYRDRALLKNPFDLALYLRLLGQLRPKTVIEVGTAEGGSAVWFADMLTVLGVEGRVVTVDRQPPTDLHDSRIDVLSGDATDLGGVLSGARLATLPKPWLVVEDSAHTFDVSLAVLRFFDRTLVAGDYIVVEDGVVRALPGEQYLAYEDGPSRAIEAFLQERGQDYAIDTDICDYYGFNATYAPNGWLTRT
jgi:cephalosporin hydroxylase